MRITHISNCMSSRDSCGCLFIPLSMLQIHTKKYIVLHCDLCSYKAFYNYVGSNYSYISFEALWWVIPLENQRHIYVHLYINLQDLKLLYISIVTRAFCEVCWVLGLPHDWSTMIRDPLLGYQNRNWLSEYAYTNPPIESFNRTFWTAPEAWKVKLLLLPSKAST